MSAQKFEAFLAKLYVDNQARSRFLADPRREALAAGLTEADCAALDKIDWIGLGLAADSFARKRASCPARKPVSKLTRWLRRR
jgi:hypothetical protein